MNLRGTQAARQESGRPGTSPDVGTSARRVRRLVGALVFGALSIVLGAPALAQAPSEPTGRIQIAAGVGWLGGAAFGGQPADLRSGGSGGAYRLFNSETDLGTAGSLEARAGVALTRRYSIEGRAGISRPELRTLVSSDAETTGSFTLEERIDQYAFDGGIVIHLHELVTMGLTPFASAGIGYVRQLHEGQQLVEDGPLYYVGGGLSRVLLARAQGFIRALSLRADLRLNLFSLDSDDGTRPQGSVSGSLVVTF
jgi:hypothetical protein